VKGSVGPTSFGACPFARSVLCLQVFEGFAMMDRPGPTTMTLEKEASRSAAPPPSVGGATTSAEDGVVAQGIGGSEAKRVENVAALGADSPAAAAGTAPATSASSRPAAAAAADVGIGDAGDPPPEMILNFHADQGRGVIFHDGVLVWKRKDHLIHPVDAATLKELKSKAEALLVGGSRAGTTTTTTPGAYPAIDPEALGERVKEVDGSVEWARYVAELTNLDRPKVENAAGQHEMLFQQIVFSPIAGLLYCFNSSNYVADGLVSSGFLCSRFTLPKKRQTDRTPQPFHNYPFTCQPDAAVLATAKTFVLATMEMKSASAGEFDPDDFFNCVLLTSSTAVALIKHGVAAAEAVLVPFVVTVGEDARLYVAHMREKDRAPAVRFLRRAKFGNRRERVWFVAHLAVLVQELMKLLQASKSLGFDEMLKCLSNRSGVDSQSGPQSSAALPKKRKQPGRSRSLSGTDRSSGGPKRPTGSGGAGAVGAEYVASCEGRVRALVPHRNGYDDSPFYF
jgi:hypothetical protein